MEDDRSLALAQERGPGAVTVEPPDRLGSTPGALAWTRGREIPAALQG